MGISRSATGVVVAAGGPQDRLGHLRGPLREGGARVFRSARGPLALFLVTGGDPANSLRDMPRGTHVGLSDPHPAESFHQGLREALMAFRFSQPSLRERGPYRVEESVVVGYGMLQGFGIFTTLTPAQINEVDVIRAMDRILEAGPPDMLMTLDSVAAAPTIRQAARVLGAHHNSVRHRVTLAERELGLSISDTYGRSQLFMGLMLRRLRETYETYPLVNADV